MPDTHTFIAIHFIFATKRRRPFLTAAIRPRLFDYMGGIVRNHCGTSLEINGTDDHIHLLALVRPTHSASDVMQVVKSRSSKWIHDEFPDLRDFQWQDGFGAFSVSLSRVPNVQEYIKNQEEHHRKMSFLEELVMFLKEHDIPYDEKYFE